MQPTIRLAWHWFTFQVPPTWEVIRHRNAADEGELHLSDRYGVTMQVFWKKLKESPPLAGRLLELVQANTGADLKEAIIRRRINGQHGWLAYFPDTGREAVFAARYLEEEKVLLSLVFAPYPKADHRPLIQQVLQSFAPNQGAIRWWAAFGLECGMPAELELVEVKALPALQVLRFEDAAGETVAVHRYGMLPFLLADGEDSATFYARIKGPKTLLHRTGSFQKDGRYPGLTLSYRPPTMNPLAGLLGTQREGRVWIWRCDDQQRLYCLDQCTRPGHTRENILENVQCR